MAEPLPALELHLPFGLAVEGDHQPEVLRRTAGGPPDEEVLKPPTPDDPLVLRLASPGELRSADVLLQARTGRLQRAERMRIVIEAASEITADDVDRMIALAVSAHVPRVVVYVRRLHA